MDEPVSLIQVYIVLERYRQHMGIPNSPDANAALVTACEGIRDLSWRVLRAGMVEMRSQMGSCLAARLSEHPDYEGLIAEFNSWPPHVVEELVAGFYVEKLLEQVRHSLGVVKRPQVEAALEQAQKALGDLLVGTFRKGLGGMRSQVRGYLAARLDEHPEYDALIEEFNRWPPHLIEELEAAGRGRWKPQGPMN